MGNDPKTANTWVCMEKVDEFTPEKIDKLVKKDRQGYILKVNIEYKNHNKLPFLADRMKIGKVEKLVTNLMDKNKVFSSHQKSESSIGAWFEPRSR